MIFVKDWGPQFWIIKHLNLLQSSDAPEIPNSRSVALVLHLGQQNWGTSKNHYPMGFQPEHRFYPINYREEHGFQVARQHYPKDKWSWGWVKFQAEQSFELGRNASFTHRSSTMSYPRPPFQVLFRIHWAIYHHLPCPSCGCKARSERRAQGEQRDIGVAQSQQKRWSWGIPPAMKRLVDGLCLWKLGNPRHGFGGFGWKMLLLGVHRWLLLMIPLVELGNTSPWCHRHELRVFRDLSLTSNGMSQSLDTHVEVPIPIWLEKEN